MGLLRNSEGDSESDREQRYEYTSVGWTSGIRKKSQSPDEKINELAENGWRLVERVEIEGTTFRFIFERPIETED